VSFAEAACDGSNQRNRPYSPQSDVIAAPRLSGIQSYIWKQERAWADRINPFLFGKVLKVGNGLGYLTQFFQQAGINVITLDVSESSAAMNKGRALLYDGEVFPFKDAAFDCVVFAFVLHHTPNPFNLLREACRVGSRIVVLEETYDTILSKIDLVTRDLYVNVLAHQHGPIFWRSYFRSGVLDRHFAQTGQNIVYHYSENKRTYLKELYVVQPTIKGVHNAQDIR
jgi:ubiquinone/menaquinone biosynthesis C-methylase UbiE